MHKKEIGLYSFLDHLEIFINQLVILCYFIKILLEYKRNLLTKTFLRNIQIWLHSGFQKNLKSESALDPKK